MKKIALISILASSLAFSSGGGFISGGGGGGGSVTAVGLTLPSIFSVSGSPVTTSGTLTGTLASQAANLVFASPNGTSGTPTFRALSSNDITGSANTLAAFGSGGGLQTLADHSINTRNGIDANPTLSVTDNGYENYQIVNLSVVPSVASPSKTIGVNPIQMQIDPTSTGLALGTGGELGSLLPLYFGHGGTSDTGSLNYIKLSSDIGNGTDAISVNGVAFVLGFGSIKNNVTLTGALQGYGFQMDVDAGATLSSNSVRAFYDNANIHGSAPGYDSFSANPSIGSIQNNANFTGLGISPQITTLTGNANYYGITQTPNLGSFGTGGFNGIYINPTITSVNNAYGLFVDMGNVTSGNKKAAHFTGDVEINGAPSFSGALSIGALNAFGQLDPVIDGGGNPTSVNSLISQINIPASATTANADTIGLNTAMLLSVGANSAVTFGPFGLFSSLALPTVIETHTGSLLPAVQGGVFALSFSNTSTGGTITEADAARFVIMPNGITTVDRSVGVKIDNPFGNVGTVNYGIYQTDAELNFFHGTLQAETGVQLSTAGSQPTCDVAHRGVMWNVEGGAGVADVLQVCQKSSSDTYAWVTH